MCKKCVFLDIDGTLRDPFYGTPQSALEAVDKARSLGHLMVICTGRPKGLIPDDFPVSRFDGIIAGGGCFIALRDKVVLDEKIAPDRAAKISGVLHEKKILHRIETENSVFMEPEMADMLGFLGEKTNNSNSEIKQMIARRNKFDFRQTIENFLESPIPAIKLCTISPSERLDEIKAVFGPDFNVIPHFNPDGTVNTEVVRSGCDKGSAVGIFCREFGIDPGNTVAFGDSMNDAQMFEASAVSVAMGNGERSLREMADMVCGDILEDGLMDGFAKAGLLG